MAGNHEGCVFDRPQKPPQGPGFEVVEHPWVLDGRSGVATAWVATCDLDPKHQSVAFLHAHPNQPPPWQHVHRKGDKP